MTKKKNVVVAGFAICTLLTIPIRAIAFPDILIGPKGPASAPLPPTSDVWKKTPPTGSTVTGITPTKPADAPVTTPKAPWSVKAVGMKEDGARAVSVTVTFENGGQQKSETFNINLPLGSAMASEESAGQIALDLADGLQKSAYKFDGKAVTNKPLTFNAPNDGVIKEIEIDGTSPALIRVSVTSEYKKVTTTSSASRNKIK